MIAFSLRCRCLVAGILAAALVPAVAAAQDAKAIYAQSQVEGDSCKKMQLACQAASIDTKNKDYSDACTRFKISINGADQRNKLHFTEAMSGGKYTDAARWARFVCSDTDKKAMLDQIAEEQKAKVVTPPPPPPPTQKDQSPTYLSDARSAFKNGNFDAALASAGKITDPAIKDIADESVVSKINAYRGAESAARQAEANHNIQSALDNWKAAQSINSNGPDGPSANIARLEPMLKVTPPPPPPGDPSQGKQVAGNNGGGKQPPPPPPHNQQAAPDVNAEVAKYLADANQNSNLSAAMHDYDAVLRLQPGNQAASDGKRALTARLNSDPAEQAKSLVQAIRDFYSNRYADAEDSLLVYLQAPTAKSKGAAYFYMGATRLNEKLLSSSNQKVGDAIANPDVQRQFSEARKAGYQPVERLVSPVILRAWKSAP